MMGAFVVAAAMTSGVLGVLVAVGVVGAFLVVDVLIWLWWLDGFLEWGNINDKVKSKVWIGVRIKIGRNALSNVPWCDRYLANHRYDKING